jgi:hypothetical protein
MSNNPINNNGNGWDSSLAKKVEPLGGGWQKETYYNITGSYEVTRTVSGHITVKKL